jgi:hypothetical protein
LAPLGIQDFDKQNKSHIDDKSSVKAAVVVAERRLFHHG